VVLEKWAHPCMQCWPGIDGTLHDLEDSGLF
jgi:hypothetical protein